MTDTAGAQNSTDGGPVHAFTDDALGSDDAVGIAQRIRRGEVTAGEVVAAAVERATRMSVLDAVAATDFETAMARVDQPFAGPLAGVPTFIKDNTALHGLPTRHGSRAVPAHPATEDDQFTKQFLAQGVVPLGKSRMPEFGLNASTEFAAEAPVRNPWNLAYSPGASSGGSAALVAAGVVPIAHANDGGGSIRIPAACCGLVGLKVTRGRLIEPESARALPVKIVVEGVVSRSVRDTAHFLAGAESFRPNPQLPPVGLVEGPNRRRLRVGVVVDSITGHPTDEPTRAAVDATAAMLREMGHQVDDMDLPLRDTFAGDFSIYWGLLSFLIATFGRRVLSPDFDRSQLDNLTRGLGKLYKRNLWRTPQVIYRLRRVAGEYRRAFEKYDVVLSPVLAHTPPRLGHLSPAQDFDLLFERLRRYVAFTPLNNAAGGPGIALPMGATDDGVPIGIHFSANHGDERTLLELAFEIEHARPWRRIQDTT